MFHLGFLLITVIFLQVLNLSCDAVQLLSADVGSENRLLSLHLHLLLEFSSTVTWPALPPPLQQVFVKLTDNFLQHLVEQGLYGALKVRMWSLSLNKFSQSRRTGFRTRFDT